VSIFDLPKIDGHCHVLDPARFAYGADIAYHPAGQEIGTADYFQHVLDAYGVRHALLVGPNSGYGYDNRCLLDAIARGQGRFKGIAVLPAGTSTAELQDLQAQGIVGVAFNAALHGFAYYQDVGPLLTRLAALGMWAQFQVSKNLLLDFLPMIEASGVQVMIDHCGRPDLADGPDAPGVRALLNLGEQGQAVIKLSGFAKFSQQAYPFDDARAHVRRVLDAYGPERCIWASDWPYLRAPYRLDYGTLLRLTEQWFSPREVRQMVWDAPAKLLGW